jgi:CxxC motif-containing protein (DUF1111 family)
LTEEERQRFEDGRKVFERRFAASEGLGPLFNAEGCAVCHAEPAVGGSSAIAEVHATRFFESGDCDPLFQEGGPVIQQRATEALREFGIEKEAIPPSATGQGLRSSPPLFGLGLVEAIPEATIVANADPDDADGDGISGKINRFIDGRLGRFGRKAFLATLADFNAGAFPLEQGLTTPLQPVEETVNGTPVPPESDPVPEPEVPLHDVEAVIDFVRFLAAPPRDKSSRQDVLRRGARLFESIGCADCHIPSMKTGDSDIAALRYKKVFLFSDLLVHDMGAQSADVCLGLAEPQEFRTELLIGLRFRSQFLHDGSARTVPEAIERHGGEAAAAREAFRALSTRNQAAVLAYLMSI